MKNKFLKIFLSLSAILIVNTNPANAMGFIYTDSTYPITATGVQSPQDLSSLKKGESSAINILGVAEWGDAGINKAAKDGNIKNINFIDVNVKTVFFFFGRVTTHVYGE